MGGVKLDKIQFPIFFKSYPKKIIKDGPFTQITQRSGELLDGKT